MIAMQTEPVLTGFCGAAVVDYLEPKQQFAQVGHLPTKWCHRWRCANLANRSSPPPPT